VIGVYSGNFDPLHKGHTWIIDEMIGMFDEVWVVVGSNPSKTRTFAPIESHKMLREYYFDYNAWGYDKLKFDILTDNNIVDWIERVLPEKEVVVVRGIRDITDACYELGITQAIRRITDKLHHIYLHPPTYLRALSSKGIKLLAKEEKWNLVAKGVSPFVLKELQGRIGHERVASIFETTTAGFGPAWDETIKSPEQLYGGMTPEKTVWKVSHHMPETLEHVEGIQEMLNFGKMPQHFDALVKFGLMSYAKEINRAQVRNMLDPCPIDVAVSEKYHLRTIYVDCVRPTGKRYKAQSESLGPIIVDLNEKLLGAEFGPVIVIEGKHRWLAARESGEKTILAWVGEKAMPIVKGPNDAVTNQDSQGVPPVAERDVGHMGISDLNGWTIDL
jgi:pantetheine-phosphate adenylyltransferase